MKRALTIAGCLVLGVFAGAATYAVFAVILGAALYSLGVNTAFVVAFIFAAAGAAVALRRRRSLSLYAFWAGVLLFLGISSVQILVLSPRKVWPLNLWA
ncbi:ABC transporter ATP-binding protein [Mycobacterium sp. 48b]|uniref:ABC transporter ATP-binding protein n=1 Tax=Mycobacterium sp. 48b TaxID=3400426 RepID=UPI003AAC63DF